MPPNNLPLKRTHSISEDYEIPQTPEQQPLLEQHLQKMTRELEREAAILSVMQYFKVTKKEINQLMIESNKDLVSFSKAKYERIALYFNMCGDYRQEDWLDITVPRVTLPSRIQAQLCKAGAAAFYASGSPESHATEAIRNAFVGAVSVVPLITSLHPLN